MIFYQKFPLVLNQLVFDTVGSIFHGNLHLTHFASIKLVFGIVDLIFSGSLKPTPAGSAEPARDSAGRRSAAV